MNAEIKGNRVSLNAPQIKSPNLVGGVNTMYDAQRKGMSELAKAHMEAGKAVASAGEMLAAYDQHNIKKEYAADMRMLNVIYAEEFSKLTHDLQSQNFSSSAEYDAEFDRRASEIKESVLSRIRGGDPAHGGFLFRNYDRWATEVEQTGDVQAATARVRATEQWIATRESVTMKVNDEKLNSIAKFGGEADVDAWAKSCSEENPQYAELYHVKGETAKQAIRIRNAANSKDQIVNNDISAHLTGTLTTIAQSADEEQGKFLEINSDDTPEVRRDKMLHNERQKRVDSEKQQEQIKAKFYVEYQASASKGREKYRTLLVDSGIDPLTQEKLLTAYDRRALEEANRIFSAYQKTLTDKELETTKNAREAWNQAKITGNQSALLQNSRYALIVPTDDHIPDLPGMAEYRFLRRGENNDKYENTAVVNISRRNTSSALMLMSHLDNTRETFFSDAERILKDLRLQGVMQEDYATVYSFFEERLSKQSPAHGKTVGYFEESLFKALVNNTDLLDDEQKKEFKTLDDILQSDVLPPDVDDFILTTVRGAQRFQTTAEAQHFIDGALGRFTEDANAKSITDRIRKKISELTTYQKHMFVDIRENQSADGIKSGAGGKAKDWRVKAEANALRGKDTYVPESTSSDGVNLSDPIYTVPVVR